MDLVRTKLSYLTSDKDQNLKNTLQEILDTSSAMKGRWQIPAQGLFFDMLEMINRNEGLDLPSPSAFEVLGDHIPAHIANILQELSELLSAASRESMEGQHETSVYLLLKVAEWVNMNYENRCLYGETMEEEAGRLFEQATERLMVWGDKDEIWSALEDILIQWGLGEFMAGAHAVLGCRTYGLVIDGIDVSTVLHSANWEGNEVPETTSLVVGLRTEAVDQTLVQAVLKAGAEDQPCPRSTSRFEKSLLSAIAQVCGSPEQSTDPVFLEAGTA